MEQFPANFCHQILFFSFSWGRVRGLISSSTMFSLHLFKSWLFGLSSFGVTPESVPSTQALFPSRSRHLHKAVLLPYVSCPKQHGECRFRQTTGGFLHTCRKLISPESGQKWSCFFRLVFIHWWKASKKIFHLICYEGRVLFRKPMWNMPMW